MLARHGPMHGHRLRRLAQAMNLSSWADVPDSSIYRTLHHLASQGLVRAVGSERVSRYPERTVYDLTDEGRLELHIVHQELLLDASTRPDAVDLAVHFADRLEEAELRSALEDRMDALRSQLRALERRRREAARWLSVRELAGLGHAELRIEADLHWLEEMLAAAGALVRDPEPGP